MSKFYDRGSIRAHLICYFYSIINYRDFVNPSKKLKFNYYFYYFGKDVKGNRR